MYVSTPLCTVFWCTIPLVVDYNIHLNSRQTNFLERAISNESHSQPSRRGPRFQTPPWENVTRLSYTSCWIYYIRINRVFYVILVLLCDFEVDIGSRTRTILNSYLCFFHTHSYITRWPAGTTEMTPSRRLVIV